MRTTSRVAPAVVVLIVAVFGCTSTSTSTNVADAGSDAGAPLPCELTIDAYCAKETCVRTWDAAKADDNLCALSHTVYAAASIAPCSGGHYAAYSSPASDNTTYYYYDPASGALVAVMNEISLGRTGCRAGPGFFAPETCKFGPASDCRGFDAGAD